MHVKGTVRSCVHAAAERASEWRPSAAPAQRMQLAVGNNSGSPAAIGPAATISAPPRPFCRHQPCGAVARAVLAAELRRRLADEIIVSRLLLRGPGGAYRGHFGGCERNPRCKLPHRETRTALPRPAAVTSGAAASVFKNESLRSRRCSLADAAGASAGDASCMGK
jgi:hypothetical protein